MSDRNKALTIWALAVVTGALGAWLLLRDRPPELTAERLSAARALWQSSGPHSYTAVVATEAAGLERQVYTVRVRDSQAQGDAATPGQQSYAVDSLFKLLERELDLARDPTAYGAPQGASAYLFASFDGRLGYPHLFRRIVGAGGRYAELRVLKLESTPE